MAVAYFNFAGTPAKVVLDEDDIPQSCEIYDRRERVFAARDELTLDVIDSYDSLKISEQEFRKLLEKVQSETGKVE